MQDIIDIYMKKNHYLALLKELAKQYDGKTMGKRFNNFLEKSGISYWYGGYHIDFHADDLSNSKTYNGDVILSIWPDEFNICHENNRLKAGVLIGFIDEQLKYNTEEIQKMKHDEENKDKLILQYNDLVKQIEKLAKSMSYEFKEKYKNEFMSIIYKCGR